MKIVIINGSPRGAKSNTLQITNAFVAGIKAERKDTVEVEMVDVSAAKINACKGCFCCWTKTPGKCVFRDDMDEILPKMIYADVVIWSFPLYYFGMPSKVKALMDRNLPTLLPYLEKRPDGGCAHPSRYAHAPAKVVLISSCGFYSVVNNYEALIKQFEIYSRGFTKILTPEGESFAQKSLSGRVNEYLSFVEQAGKEYALGRPFSKDTQQNLDTLLYPAEAFVEMANASWEIEDLSAPLSQAEKEQEAAHRFTKQMAATYNPASFDGVERVFEICYTDSDTSFQLVLGKDRCIVRTEGFSAYTTKVETPFTVWQEIAQGQYSGEQAMMEGKYRTFGDLKMLMSWNLYFGAGGSVKERVGSSASPVKKSNMSSMLLVWMVIWILMSIHATIGALAGIIAVALVGFMGSKWTFTIYDSISCLCVTICSLLVLQGSPVQVIVPLSYLVFGLMWLGSCLTKIPLTAHYSKYEYGDNALSNPLFMKTNRILTMIWGGLYLITPIWTYYLLGTSMPYLVAPINMLCPIALGVFTMWFQKWYPAKIARG